MVALRIAEIFSLGVQVKDVAGNFLYACSPLFHSQLAVESCWLGLVFFHSLYQLHFNS